MQELEELKNAIEHCQEVQQQACTNDQCKADHKQLEMWLKELLELKTTLKS